MPIPFVMNRVSGFYCMTESPNASLLARVTHKVMSRKAEHIYRVIGKYLPPKNGAKILDVGMGAGSISCMLMKKGYDVTGIDVADLSMYEDIKATIYGGVKMNFKDKQFDCAVIIHVLHHCSDMVGVLKEAKRVAKRVIFIEDTHRNEIERKIISANDMVTNWEFYRHPYKTISEWRQVVETNNWKTIATKEWSEWFMSSAYSHYCMFVLE